MSRLAVFAQANNYLKDRVAYANSIKQVSVIAQNQLYTEFPVGFHVIPNSYILLQHLTSWV